MIETLDFPLFIKWYITQRCNLRCKHCYLTDYTQSPSLEQIVSIIDFLGKHHVAGVVLIGGEPVVRSDLPDIVRRLHTYGIRTTIATNATLIDAHKAQTLVAAGGLHFQVSLDGATAVSNDSIRGDGNFARVTSAIARMQRAGLKVNLAFCIHQRN